MKFNHFHILYTSKFLEEALKKMFKFRDHLNNLCITFNLKFDFSKNDVKYSHICKNVNHFLILICNQKFNNNYRNFILIIDQKFEELYFYKFQLLRVGLVVF